MLGLENAYSDVAIKISFVLITVPLILYVTMMLLINKKKINKIKFYSLTKNNNEVMNGDTEMVVDTVIDDKMRQNATICDM